MLSCVHTLIAMMCVWGVRSRSFTLKLKTPEETLIRKEHRDAAATLGKENTLLPILIWHGMGDNAESGGMLFVKHLISDNVKGVYVKSVEIGDSAAADTKAGFLTNVNDQIETVCKDIVTDDRFQHGFHAIGFSQGAQFLRGLVEKCDGAKVKNLISIGGQHQGVYGLPQCGGFNFVCNAMRKAASWLAYKDVTQANNVQAEYWHDPTQEGLYKNKSVFLAKINNELEKNEKYVSNLQSVDNFVMVKFNQDSMVIPSESSWFGFCDGDGKVLAMEDTELYQSDRLGLQKMKQDNKLVFLDLDGDHLQYDQEWFVETIIPYFS